MKSHQSEQAVVFMKEMLNSLSIYREWIECEYNSHVCNCPLVVWNLERELQLQKTSSSDHGHALLTRFYKSTHDDCVKGATEVSRRPRELEGATLGTSYIIA